MVYIACHLENADVAEWQTRCVQVAVSSRRCRFNSYRRHHFHFPYPSVRVITAEKSDKDSISSFSKRLFNTIPVNVIRFPDLNFMVREFLESYMTVLSLCEFCGENIFF